VATAEAAEGWKEEESEEISLLTSPRRPTSLEVSVGHSPSPGGVTHNETDESPVSEHYRARSHTAAVHNSFSDGGDDDDGDVLSERAWSV